MFTLKSPKEKTGVEKAIDKLLVELNDYKFYNDEYVKIMDQLERLYKLRDSDKSDRVSLDTLVLVAGNLAGIMLIVVYERANIMTSKALNFLLKTR